jgi:hypothetical protein
MPDERGAAFEWHERDHADLLKRRGLSLEDQLVFEVLARECVNGTIVLICSIALPQGAGSRVGRRASKNKALGEQAIEKFQPLSSWFRAEANLEISHVLVSREGVRDAAAQ